MILGQNVRCTNFYSAAAPIFSVSRDLKRKVLVLLNSWVQNIRYTVEPLGSVRPLCPVLLRFLFLLEFAVGGLEIRSNVITV